jgi:hypothetical protein
MQGSSFIFTSRGDINVNGVIDTSGRGPLYGPGAPGSEHVGRGASYGGSGGRPECDGKHYSNLEEQVQYTWYTCNAHIDLTIRVCVLFLMVSIKPVIVLCIVVLLKYSTG